VLDKVVGGIESDSFAAGATIFSQGSEPVEYLRVIRHGAVELVHNGRVLDLLGVGELFGHASMLTGLPTGFEARAAEDTVCYRIPARLAHELLSVPEGLRYVARLLLEAPVDLVRASSTPTRDAANQPIRSLLRSEPVVCTPDTPIREAARRMTATGATCVVIELGQEGLGILTDRDLRTRVLAEGVSGEARWRR